MGFYGGAGLGFTLNINEKVFLQAEYEWSYMSNTVYVDGFVNSITAGLGFKF
jgi:opacity protein-like surface antigen